MLIPYRPKILPIVRAKPRYIIIHDLQCMYHGIDQVKIDAKKSQMMKARDYNWILNGQPDVNYHFICEKIGKDYETLSGRPLGRMCQYPDIPDVYDTKAIHIAAMGRYSVIKPEMRFYQQMAYRPISSMMYLFGIPMTNIYLHHEISNDKKMACPGPFFDKKVLLSQIKVMRAK